MFTNKERNCFAGFRFFNVRSGIKKLIFTLTLILIGTMLFAAGRGQRAAGDFPTRPITIINPYAAGGGSDLILRIMAEFGQQYLGQPVVVTNVTGAAGLNGMLAALDARSDGYTLVLGSVDMLTIPMLGISGRVRPDTFEVLAAANGDPASIIVRTDSPWATFSDFLADARRRPGQITVANAGAGNIWHLSAIALEDAAAVSFNHVPYDGAASAVTALLGGHVDAVVANPGEVDGHIAAGTLRALAVAAEERLAAFPDVPTYREYGIDLVIIALRGVAVTADTPEHQKAVLREAFSRLVHNPDVRRRIEDARMTYMPMDAQQFQSVMNSMEASLSRAIDIFKR